MNITKYGPGDTQTQCGQTPYPETLSFEERVAEIVPQKEKEILASMSPAVWEEIWDKMDDETQKCLVAKIMREAVDGRKGQLRHVFGFDGVWLAIEKLAEEDAEAEILAEDEMAESAASEIEGRKEDLARDKFW